MDALAERILNTYDVITVVGASASPAKAAHAVPAHMQRLGWRIIPVNPHADVILGEPVFRTLAEVPEQVGLVDVFRPSAQTADIARQAVAAGATALWLQLGIVSAQARAIAEDAGLLYVEDRCLVIEQRRRGLTAPGRAAAVAGPVPGDEIWEAFAAVMLATGAVYEGRSRFADKPALFADGREIAHRETPSIVDLRITAAGWRAARDEYGSDPAVRRDPARRDWIELELRSAADASRLAGLLATAVAANS
jgi:uncharacterized protein